MLRKELELGSHWSVVGGQQLGILAAPLLVLLVLVLVRALGSAARIAAAAATDHSSGWKELPPGQRRRERAI